MATLDIFTIEQAKAGIQVSVPTDQDDVVQLYVSAISQRFDDADVCGPIVRRTVTDEVASGGRSWVSLAHRPVTTVSVTVGDVAFTDYTVDREEGVLWNNRAFELGNRNIKVTYIAGRFDTTAEVDARFVQAAQIMFTHLWTAERGAGSSVFGDVDRDYAGRFGVLATGVPSFAIPKASREILGAEYRGTQAWVA